MNILSLSFPAGLWVGRVLSSYKVRPSQIPKTTFFSGSCRMGGHRAVISPRGLPHLWGLPGISVKCQFTNSSVISRSALSAGTSPLPQGPPPSQLCLASSLESSHLYESPTTRKETAHKARMCRSLSRLAPLYHHHGRQGIFLTLPGCIHLVFKTYVHRPKNLYTGFSSREDGLYFSIFLSEISNNNAVGKELGICVTEKSHGCFPSLMCGLCRGIQTPSPATVSKPTQHLSAVWPVTS